MKRIPEPELMDSEAQSLAYAQANFAEPNQLFIDSFLARFPQLPSKGLGIDLGCGPADITIRFARQLPGWLWDGLDAGQNMLKLAEEAVMAQGLETRVNLLCKHLPDVSLDERYDAIVSNSLLHHLPDPDSLWLTINQLANPGSRVMIMDLIRPETPEGALALVGEHAMDEPDVLKEDFYNSLCAAYTLDEIQSQLDSNGLDQLNLEAVSDRHWQVWGQM